MKKKKIVTLVSSLAVVAVVLTLIFTGVLSLGNSNGNGNNGTEPVNGTNGNGSNHEPDPLVYYDEGPIDIGSVPMRKVVAPAYIEFTVSEGATVSGWTNSSYVKIGEARVHYRVGEDLCLYVYNGQNFSVEFYFQYTDMPGVGAKSDITGRMYRRAPEGFSRYVTMPTAVLISPYHVRKIPFSFYLPEGLDYPSLWEFRIWVTNEHEGLLTTAAEIRMFIEMVE